MPLFIYWRLLIYSGLYCGVDFRPTDPRVSANLPWNFHWNRFNHFYVILFRKNKQTNKQTTKNKCSQAVSGAR